MRTSTLTALVGIFASASAQLKVESIARIDSAKSIMRGQCDALHACKASVPGSYVPDPKTFFLPNVHNKLSNSWGLCKHDAYCNDDAVYNKVMFNFRHDALVFDFNIPGAEYKDVAIRIQRETPPTDASPSFGLHNCQSNGKGGLSCSIPYKSLNCHGPHDMCPTKDEGGWVFYSQIKLDINLNGESFTLYNKAIEKATGTCWFSFSYCCTKCPTCPAAPPPSPPCSKPCQETCKSCEKPQCPGSDCHKPHKTYPQNCGQKPCDKGQPWLPSRIQARQARETITPVLTYDGPQGSNSPVVLNKKPLDVSEEPVLLGTKTPQHGKPPAAVIRRGRAKSKEIDVACQSAQVVIYGQGAHSHNLNELRKYPGHEECKDRKGHYHTYVKHDLEVTVAGALELNSNAFGSFIVEFDKKNKDTEIIIKLDVWNALYYVVEAAVFIDCKDGIVQNRGGRHGSHICRPETFPYWYVDEKGIGNYDFHVKDEFKCKGDYVFALWVKVCIAGERKECHYQSVRL